MTEKQLREQAERDREVESLALMLAHRQRDEAHGWAQRLAGTLAALIHADSLTQGRALEILLEAEAAGIEPYLKELEEAREAGRLRGPEPQDGFTVVPCPTCGGPCKVVTGDEGTSHFEPVRGTHER